VLNNQPQGGFITRKPTVDVRVARGDVVDDDGGFGSFFQWGGQAVNPPQPVNPQRRLYYRQMQQPQQRGWW